MPSSKPKYHAILDEESHASSGHKLPLHQDPGNQLSDGEDEDDLSLSDHFEGADSMAPRQELHHTGQKKGLLQRLCYCCWCCHLSQTSLIIITFVAVVVITLLAGGGFWIFEQAPKDGLSPPWYPTPLGGTVETWQESYGKAKKMVEQMTLIEKVNITTGTGWSMNLCVGNTGPADSVGFPSLCLQDGPLGIRFADHSTAFPAGLTIGATWNRTLMRQRGAAHGREARLKGVNVLLGPVVGPIGRNPAGGRIWEGFGADPVLQGVAASETIQGIQGEGVMATVKHFVGNEQEHFRQSFEWALPNALSSNIDDRTLHELYVWPFAESVKAGVAAVMCSYQMVNNSYACGNSKLMNGILKDELGFQGFIMSDWVAQRSGVASALAGLDMSMPGDGLRLGDGHSLWGNQLTLAVLNGSVPMERINDMATRIVAAWYQLGQDSWQMPPPKGNGGPNFSSWTQKRIGKLHEAASNSHDTAVVNQFVNVQGNDSILARSIAAEGTVVVKNDGILPLSRNGSSAVSGTKYRVAVIGEDAGPGNGPNACPDRGCNQGTLAVGWGSGATEFSYLVDPFTGILAAFNDSQVQVTGYLENDVTQSLRQNLKEQDLCLVFANSDGGEGYIAWNGVRGDRNDLNLQKGGDALIQAVAESCGGGSGSTIVVIHAIGPVVVESWADLRGIKAIVLAHLPGEESGHALVDVLFGDVDASGRLPYTVGKSLEDYGPGARVLYYPNHPIPQVDFNEGLFIDYRHFDEEQIEPRYPFGFGLSYTSFEYLAMNQDSKRPNKALPDAPKAGPNPPTYDNTIPSPISAVFPRGFFKLTNYIYPYISSVEEVKSGKYPYPKGYETPQSPSAAGGGEGGNPALYESVASFEISLRNNGTRAGQEVVQLYVSFPDNVIEPSNGEKIRFPRKVLRNFQKVELQPGEETKVNLTLTRKDLSYWSTEQQNWVMPLDGTFTISVGSNSRNLPLQVQY